MLGDGSLSQAYLRADPSSTQRVTVPAIVGTLSGVVLTNDHPQISLDLSTEWPEFQGPGRTGPAARRAALRDGRRDGRGLPRRQRRLVFGDSARYARAPAELAAALVDAVTAPVDGRLASGRDLAGSCSWDTAAAAHVEFYRELMADGRLGRPRTGRATRCAGCRRHNLRAQRNGPAAQRDGVSRSYNDRVTSCTLATTGLAFEGCPGQHIAVVPTARIPDVEEHMRNGARGLVLSGGIAACLVIAGCGGSSSSSTPSASSGATSEAPAPAATSDAPAPAATSEAPAPAATSAAPAASGGKVGILLPDTQSSNRWVTSDPVALKAQCAKYKLTCDIQNANNDPARMVTIAQSMMNNGAKLLLVTPLDPASAGKIETAAKAAGVITIDYDRLASGGSASLYVSFDNTKVGELQGQALTQCAQVKGKSAVSYVDINGSKTDNNATLFKGGYDSVLSKTAGWTKKDDQWIAEWNNQQAGVTFASMLQSNPSLNAVMVANDGMAGSVIAGLKKQKLNGKVAVSGQDATVAGIQAVLAGDQCFTIYKPSTGEADPAIKAAAALLAGNAPETTQTIKDPVSGREVPAILATPVVITKANVNVPIADGYAPKAQVCAGSFAALCTAAGVK